MCYVARFTHLRRLVESMPHAIGALAAIATGSMLLGTSLPAQASVALFNSVCSRCHNNVVHPRNLVYNAAGNAGIIETLNALGMGATGSAADNISIATYLDSVKPTITLAKVAHNSPRTAIKLGDITVSASERHHDWQIIERIETVSPPMKGTVEYLVANGFAQSSIANYTPFPGQSGTDTWTYQGIGSRGNTTIRTASVIIAPGDDLPATSYQGLWWNSPAGSESGWGINFAHQGDTIFATWFTFDSTASRCGWSSAAHEDGAGRLRGQRSITGTGPAFNAVPFDPGSRRRGGGRHGDAHLRRCDNATFAYTVNGVAQTKQITRAGVRRRCRPAPWARSRISRRRPTSRTCGGPRRRARNRGGASISRTRATRSSRRWFTYRLRRQRRCGWSVGAEDLRRTPIRGNWCGQPDRRSTRSRFRRRALRVARRGRSSEQRISLFLTATPELSRTQSTA